MNLTETKNTESILSPKLSHGSPPGSGMFCVSSSDPGQVFSCCRRAAAGLLCPSSRSPSSPEEKARSQVPPRVRSKPTSLQLQLRGLSWPRSICKTLCRIPCHPCQGARRAEPTAGLGAVPAPSPRLRGGAAKGTTPKLEVRRGWARFCLQRGRWGGSRWEKGRTTSRAAEPGRREENQLNVPSPAPALRVPETRKHVPPSPWADPVAVVLKGLQRQLPGEASLIFVYKGGKQKG